MLPKSIFPVKFQMRLHHAILLCAVLSIPLILFMNFSPDVIPQLIAMSITVLIFGAWDEYKYNKSLKEEPK